VRCARARDLVISIMSRAKVVLDDSHPRKKARNLQWVGIAALYGRVLDTSRQNVSDFARRSFVPSPCLATRVESTGSPTHWEHVCRTHQVCHNDVQRAAGSCKT